MIDGQSARKIARIFRAAANVAARSRTGKALLAGIRATARSFGRVLHQLWLEVAGFMFLAIAGIGALAGLREYGIWQLPGSGRSLAYASTGSIRLAIRLDRGGWCLRYASRFHLHGLD